MQKSIDLKFKFKPHIQDSRVCFLNLWKLKAQVQATYPGLKSVFIYVQQAVACINPLTSTNHEMTMHYKPKLIFSNALKY